jgi:hypothetical protein
MVDRSPSVEGDGERSEDCDGDLSTMDTSESEEDDGDLLSIMWSKIIVWSESSYLLSLLLSFSSLSFSFLLIFGVEQSSYESNEVEFIYEVDEVHAKMRYDK